MSIAGFHQWTVFSGASGNNTPDVPRDLPFTGQDLVLYILIASIVIMAGLFLRLISDR